jgi:GDP-mannose 6-dehydrogenase
MGVDTQAVTDVFLADTRLNVSAAYLFPGFAFGGSCLPKDLRALAYRSRELDLHLPLLEAIQPSNIAHIERAVEAVLRTNKRKVGVLGLGFKSGTDDLRESPLVHIVKRLLGEGYECRIWDENVALGRLIGSNRQFIEETIPHVGSLLCSTLTEAVESADVVVIGTKLADREVLRRNLRPGVLVLDLVNLEKSQRLSDHKPYEGICW